MTVYSGCGIFYYNIT